MSDAPPPCVNCVFSSVLVAFASSLTKTMYRCVSFVLIIGFGVPGRAWEEGMCLKPRNVSFHLVGSGKGEAHAAFRLSFSRWRYVW